MTLPALRREGGTIVGHHRRRVLRSRLKHACVALACALRGHDWGEWRVDDYDGPGEYMEGDADSFMPYLSRESRPGEFGTRTCRRRCGASEHRWPEADAPPFWRDRLAREEAERRRRADAQAFSDHGYP